MRPWDSSASTMSWGGGSRKWRPTSGRDALQMILLSARIEPSGHRHLMQQVDAERLAVRQQGAKTPDGAFDHVQPLPARAVIAKELRPAEPRHQIDRGDGAERQSRQRIGGVHSSGRGMLDSGVRPRSRVPFGTRDSAFACGYRPAGQLNFV
jgi:hypothetical protein